MERHTLYSRTRERILQILYDGKEKSAYQIAKELDISPATAIEHLTELISENMVVAINDGRGKKYKITHNGKNKLTEFEKQLFEKIPEEIKRFLANSTGTAAV